MGINFSNDKNDINTFIYLDNKEKPIKCKKISEDNHFNNNYIFMKPNKKINYLKYNKIQVLVEKKKGKLLPDFNMPALFDSQFDLHRNLVPNIMGEKKYLENRVQMIENDVSVVLRINSDTHLLENLILIVPSEIYT